MPKDNDTRQCTEPGCKGTQRLTANADVELSNVLHSVSGRPVLPKPALAWLCDIKRGHYEIVRP